MRLTKKFLLITPLFISLLFSCKTEKEQAVVEKDTSVAEVVEKVEPEATLTVEKVHFDYDKSDVKAEYKESLKKVAEFMAKKPDAKVEVEGHCDSRGTTQYNLALGQRRADSVRAFLKTLGVDENRVVTKSRGKEELTCQTDTEPCHASNRRVQIRVVG